MTQETEKGWSGYRPSKSVWFWSCAGSVVATMVLGFSWGGWVMGSTAEYQAAEAREIGRAELAATICVARFTAAPDARTQLVALQEESTWSRDNVVEDGGWATPVGLEEPVEGAADRCAEQLAAMKLPLVPAVDEGVIEEAAIEPATQAN